MKARRVWTVLFVGTVWMGGVVAAISILIGFAPLKRAIASWITPVGGDSFSLAVTAAVILLALLSGVVLAGWFGWRAIGQRVFTEAGRCPACAAGLATATVEPDGCTVCPECGAAWRLGEEGTKARSHEGTEGEE